MDTHQLFTMELENTEPETIEAAKRLMYNCATEMGFCGYHSPFEVEQYKDVATETTPYRLNATFYMQPPALILP